MPETTLNSETLFNRLLQKLKGRTDFQQRVTAHIRAKHGHTTIPSFHRNGVSEEDKFKTYGECLAAIIRAEKGETDPWSRLQGQIPNGQAAPVAPSGEAQAAPAAGVEHKPVTRDSLADTPKPASTPLLPSAPIAPPPKAAVPQNEALVKLAESLASLLPSQPAPIDESVVKRIVEEALATYQPDFGELQAKEMVDSATKNLAEQFEKTLATYQPVMDPKQLSDAVDVALQSSVGQAISKGLAKGELRPIPYLLPVDSFYVRNQTGIDIADSFQDEHPLMVSGPSGSGKTFPIEQELRRANRKYLPPISVADGLTRQDLIIRQTIQQNASATGVETVWRYGVLPFAMLHGLGIILDEFDQLQPELAAVIYYVAEYRKLLIPETGETIEAKSGFQIFATCNGLRDTTGLYSGFRLSNALTNRFDFVKADYLPPQDEIAIFKKYGVDATIATKLANFLTQCRNLYNTGKLTFAPSTRVGCRISRKISQGTAAMAALNKCMVYALPPNEAALVTQVANASTL